VAVPSVAGLVGSSNLRLKLFGSPDGALAIGSVTLAGQATPYVVDARTRALRC
jgi:hypothetical protein